MIHYSTWYVKDNLFRKFIMGTMLPRLDDLRVTHTRVRQCSYQTHIEAQTRIMLDNQGEMWSPDGQAQELLKKLGLSHTSMSVGDVFVRENDGHVWAVRFVGFSHLGVLSDYRGLGTIVSEALNNAVENAAVSANWSPEMIGDDLQTYDAECECYPMNEIMVHVREWYTKKFGGGSAS